MTEIAFHVNAPDKLDYACRLLRATQKKSAQVLVLGQIDALKSLSSKLWALSPTEFLPHCLADAEPAVLAQSPIVLSAELPANAADKSSGQQVLLNLGAVLPAGFERFERLIELVGQDADDLQAARTRWKHYKDRGYALSRYDVVSKVQTSH
jgi:DNA polymerase III subunit chi